MSTVGTSSRLVAVSSFFRFRAEASFGRKSATAATAMKRSQRENKGSQAVIISAAYLLWAIQRILFNPLDKPENEHIPDLNKRELAVMLPLIACIVWLGVYPAPVLRRMQGAAERFVSTVNARRDMPAMFGDASDVNVGDR